jgi:hypothetical protein
VGPTPEGTPALAVLLPIRLALVWDGPEMGLSLLARGLGREVMGIVALGIWVWPVVTVPAGGLRGRSFKLKPLSRTKWRGSLA